MRSNKKIAIFCVTYRSYKALYDYYQSLVKAAELAKCIVEFHVADNTDSEYETIKLSQTEWIHPHVFPFHENLGYFGAIRKTMQQVEFDSFDYVILSNVDMTVDVTCLEELCKSPANTNTGWIAPQIFSLSEKRDLNPALWQRYSKKKLQLVNMLYLHPWILRLYELTLYKRKHLQANMQTKAGSREIYAGHGSFIILTKEYIKRCGIIDYPVFLYDEELYLAEECRSHELKVMYEPSIKIYDIGKISTGKMPSDFYCRCNKEGIDFILKKYY